MAKHSKGDWYVDEGGNFINILKVPPPETKGLTLRQFSDVRNAMKPSDVVATININYPFKITKQHRLNGSLIGTAPTMLKVLENCRAYLEVGPLDNEEILNDVIATIAKARGES